MSSTDHEREQFLREAFLQAKIALIERRPTLGLLADDSALWRRVSQRIADGYDSGIGEMAELTIYAEMALPNLRGFRSA
ncbi:MAG: hypothetical protein K0S00_1952 [Xanthobacteraceae bacterium]|jgi:hypothetical protein|nr:hypothetical protein [Xanthobacteraceae bacterium]